VQQDSGEWVLDKDHRFFTDDIRYGLCIAKWMADQLGLEVPAIDKITTWVQDLRHEKIIVDGKLLLDDDSQAPEFLSGVPPVYGIDSIDGILD
jgi:hypothetical protein